MHIQKSSFLNMFCVFLQNIPPDEHSTLNITHNDIVYTISKELAMKNSKLISDLLNKQSDETINIDYEHEYYDDFQLISDLFNYKRIFITHMNIDFLEFSANYLNIPVLLKKITKFRNHYNDFLKNPIFEEIKSLEKQVFSILKKESSCNKDYDSNKSKDDNYDISNQQSDISNDINSNSQQNNESKNQNTNDDLEDIQKIKYKPEYASTVAHLIFAACLSNPFNFEKYIKIIANDLQLIQSITQIHSVDSFCSYYTSNYKSLLLKYMPPNSKLPDYEYKLSGRLDTNVRSYFNNIWSFYEEIFDMKNLFPTFVNAIKYDDIGLFQQLYVSNEKILKDSKRISNLFQICAIYSSIKCFKFLLLNYSSYIKNFFFDRNIVRSAIMGGNIEIFRLSLEKYSGDSVEFIKDSIFFHRTNILKWLIRNDIQFLSLYNCCCSRVLYGTNYIRQKWYKCPNCHPIYYHGVCKFCAKHCHSNEEGEKKHNTSYVTIQEQCFCDDDCPLSKNIELIGTKKFVEIDDLILLSIYCLNTSALKALIKEGANILKCRDISTKNAYSLLDDKLIELISSMNGYKANEKL